MTVTTSQRTGEKLGSYKAELEILQLSKGKLEPGDIIEVRFVDIERGLAGGWEVFYYPGEEVWTHLVRDDAPSRYRTTWWNARGETLREADTTELPDGSRRNRAGAVRGETLTAARLAWHAENSFQRTRAIFA